MWDYFVILQFVVAIFGPQCKPFSAVPRASGIPLRTGPHAESTVTGWTNNNL